MNLGLGVIIRWKGRIGAPSLTQSISQSLTFVQSGIDSGHISTVLNSPGNVAYYPLDTTLAGTAPNANLTSSAPALTYSGSPTTLQAGAGSQTGKSTTLGGGSYATVTDNVFDFTSAFTLSAFVKLPDPPRDSAYSVIASGSYLSGLIHVVDYALYAEGPGGRFQFAVTNSIGSTVTVESTTVPIAGSWYQIQVTYDGAFINMYVNGILENQTAQTGVLFAATGRTFSVGALADGSQTFPGSVDDIAAYNTALSGGALSSILRTAGNPKARITTNIIEVSSTRTPKARISTNALEVLYTRGPKARISANVIEVLRPPYSILDQHPTQTLSFIQSSTCTFILNLDISQSFILTQHVHYDPPTIRQSLTFIQTVTYDIIKAVSQSLTFVQDARAEQDHVYQSLTFVQAASLSSIHNLSVTQSLTFTQSVRFPPYFFHQSLSFIQTLSQSIIRPVHSALIFSQTLTFSAIRRIQQTLSFSQLAHQISTRSFPVSQTLTLIEGYNKPLPIHLFPASVPIPSTPPSITTIPDIHIDNNIQPQPANHSVFIPSATYIIAPKKCIFILGAKDLSVVLPCPIFGDSQGFTSTTTIKRTMTGAYFTYNKISNLQKLSYIFNIYKNKMYEVRNFMIKYMSSIIFVQNHKSELWLCYVTSNPITFTSKSRWGGPCPEEGNDKVEFTLELQGARLL